MKLFITYSIVSALLSWLGLEPQPTTQTPATTPVGEQIQSAPADSAAAKGRRVFDWTLGGVFIVTEQAPMAPMISATKVDELFVDNGATGYSPGDVIRYTIVINNAGSMDATGVTLTDVIDANTTLVPGSLESGPIPFADAYNCLGNVGINVPAGSGLLVNDVDLDNAPNPMTVTAINTAGTQGQVVHNANGSFTFMPNAGFEGMTTFTYDVTDGTFTNTGTVTITVNEVIWFIDNDAAGGGDGRLLTPFNTLPAYFPGAADDPGDIIFLYRDVATNYAGPLTLQNNQVLIGAGASQSIVAITGITVPPHSNPLPPTGGGNNPVIAHTATNLTLASANKWHGVNISNTTGGTAVTGASVGNLQVRDASINHTAGTALSISAGGVLDVIFKSISASNATTGVTVQNTTGSFEVTGTGATDASGGTISNITQRGVQFSNSTNVTLKNMTFTNANTVDGGVCGAADNSGCNGAIHLNAVTNVDLDNIDINGTVEQGLNIRNTSGLSLTNSNLINCGSSSSGSDTEESCLYAIGLTGTCEIVNSSLTFAAERAAVIFNSSQTLTLNVSGSTFGQTQAMLLGADAFEFDGLGTSNSTLDFSSCTFTTPKTNGLQVISDNTAFVSADVTGCTFNPGAGGAAAVDFVTNGNGDMDFNIVGNPSIQSRSINAVNISGNGSSTLEGRINDNTVSIASGGTGSGIGIRVINNGNSNGKVEIHNNNVTAFTDPGIYAQAVGGTGRLDAKITNNTVAVNTATGSYYIDVIAGASSSVLTNKTCANVANNATGSVTGSIIANWRARSATASHELLLQGGGATATANWNANTNTPAAPPGAVNQSGSGVFTFGATCLLPTNPPPLAPDDPVDALVTNDSTQGLTELAPAAPADGDSVVLEKTAPASDPATEAGAADNAAPVEMSMSGETVSAGPFTLPANQDVTFRFRVTIDNPFPAFDCSVSNQATISGSNFSSVQTDDPSVGGANDPTVSDFPPMTLGNLVYKDNNKNGVFDAGDAGINAVTVNLYKDINNDNVLTVADGPVFATTVTNGGGLYTFASLCPGHYIVETPPANFNPGGPLYDNALMSALLSSPIGGAPDPDNDVNNDDNGDAVSGFGVATQAITLALGTEPTTDGDADANTNLTLDLGFKSPTQVTINDVTMAEGTGGSTTSFMFTVTRSDNVEAFSLTVNTMNGTATTADNDYAGIASGTVSFTAGGLLTETVTVLVNHDNKVEANETFTVVLSGAPSGVVITDNTGLGTINNDDAAIVTLTGGGAANEGNAGTTPRVFTATLDNPVQGGFMVAYTTNNGTATTADLDYVDNDGSLTFTGTAGEMKTITVQVNGDLKVELDETFTVALGAISGAPAGVTTAGSPQTGTITNDDAAVITINTPAVLEAAGPLGFVVTLSNPVDVNVSFTIASSDGTATVADNDYALSSGSASITAGLLMTTVNVTVNNDNKVEADEMMTETFSALNASGRAVTFVGGGPTLVRTGTIINDDAAVVTLTGGGSANEGNTGTTPRVFTATLNNPVQGGFTLPYTTNDGTATTADNDYIDNDGPALVFAGTAAEAKTITVFVNGDSKVEANETFTVVLGAISGAPAGVTTAGSPQTGTITNDEVDWGDGPDSLPTPLFMNGARHNTLLGFHLGAALDGDPDGQSTGGTHNNLANGDDTDADGDDEDGVTLPSVFVTGTTATITVNASQPGKLDAFMDFNWNRVLSDAGEKIFNNVSLVAGDNVLTFSVPPGAVVGSSFLRFRFSSAGGLSNSGLAADGEVEDYRTNIVSNQFSIDNPSVVEGAAGTTSLTFTVSRTTNNTASSVDYAITGGSATSGSDYVPLAAGTVNFPMGGVLSMPVTVTVNGDLVVEDNETIIITLSNPVNGGLGANPGTGTITNDDLANLTLTGGASQPEGNLGTTPRTFTVTLSAAVQGGFTVAYTTNDGSATAPSDYVDNDGTLTFAGTAGESQTFTVLANGDLTVELSENFTTTLGAIGSTTAVQAAAITKLGSPQISSLVNDDAATVSLAGNVSQAENLTPQVFTVTLSNPVDVAVTVLFNTSNGTAMTSDNDYNGIVNQTVTFAANTTTSQTVNVTINNDNKVEANEVYNVGLGSLNASGRNVSLGTSAGTGTIVNDDAAVVTLSGGSGVNEGNTGTTSRVFTATLNNPVQGGFLVNYFTDDGTATTANNDYVDNDGALNFAGTAGEAKTITVLVNGDFFVEADETFTVTLFGISGAPPGVTIAGSPQTGTILNDEVDYGDAPDPTYPTLGASNGARHMAILGFRLGAALDGDPDGQPNGTATGDDTDAEGDDEDGVTLPNPLVTNTTANITVNASAAGKLDGWVDFNNNGSWADAGERVFNNVSLVAGNNSLSFAVPAGATPSNTFARFRFSSAGVPTFDASAPDGEVEDYQVTIVNTQFSINDPTVVEGNAGTSNLTFVITRSNNASACSVNYAITGGTATVADNDYQALAAGTASFTAGGALTQNVTVLVNGDVKVELNETVDMTLSAPVNGSILDGSGTGTITNDDAAIITITNPTVTEGDVSTTTTMTFTINMSNPSDANVSLNYTTMDGSATVANNDYVPTSGSHTFTPGQLSKTVAVTVNGDCAIEAIEILSLQLTSLNPLGRNVTFSGGGATLSGTGTINNDDALPVISCPPNLTVNAITGTCAATVTLALPTTSSICGTSTLEFRYRTVDALNNPTGSFTAYAPAAGNTVSFLVERYEIEWRVTDGSGASSCSFYLQVNDIQPPSITCPANQNIPAGPTCMGTVGAWSPVALSDNCAPPPPTVTQTPPASTVLSGHNDSEVVTLKATDEYGNMATCTFTVTLKDVTPPLAICKNAMVNLGVNGSVTVAPSVVNNGSSDNCGVTLTLTPNTFTCANIGTNTVTLKATDPGGNMATCTAVVTIKDATAPTALCKTINVFLDNTGHASITANDVDNGSFDACGIATKSISLNTFDCSQIGGSPVVVQLTLKDNYNNQSSCLANVYVKDNLPPTAICSDITVNLGSNGKVTVQTAPLAANSYDNCSVWSYLPVAKVYTTFNLGVNSLTITVKDWSGNSDVCVSQVTVLPAGSQPPPNGGGTDTEMQIAEPSDAVESTRALDVLVFPNPTAGDVTVVFVLENEQPYQLRLFDLNGRLLRHEQLDGFAGENAVTLPLGDLPTGLYFLDILTEMIHGRQKIVVQK